MRTKFAWVLLGLSLSLTVQAAPQIQHWQSASGAKVYFVENHDLPMLDVAVDFAAGSGYDDPARPGVAALTAGLLEHGAGAWNEDDIARRMADLGAELAARFDPDRAGMTLRTLSYRREREQALALLADILQAPHFPEAVLAREKARTIAAIKEAETRPDSIASKAFGRAVFGGHPYGITPEAADVERIQRDEVLAFYRSHYAAARAVVALMGDITRAEAERIAEQLTARLPAGGAPAAVPPVTLRIAASEQRIAHPATQSHILIGAPGMARNDPDYFPLYVGNYILGGGGFVSRLMHEIREQRGMAYSVYSYFIPLQQPGAFQIGLQTKKEQTDEALRQVRLTLQRFIEQGITGQELRAAKQNLVLGFPLRIDSNRKILDYLSVIGFYGLPLNYLETFPHRVEAVTVDQIRDAFRRRIDTNALATVVVGGDGRGAAK